MHSRSGARSRGSCRGSAYDQITAVLVILGDLAAAISIEIRDQQATGFRAGAYLQRTAVEMAAPTALKYPHRVARPGVLHEVRARIARHVQQRPNGLAARRLGQMTTHLATG